MNDRKLLAVIAAVPLLSAPLALARPLAQVKVSIVDARAAALRQVPGTVVGEQLEHENGRDVYSFEVRANNPPGTTEVHVDATSGAVVAVENQNDEQGEHEDDERDDDGR